MKPTSDLLTAPTRSSPKWWASRAQGVSFFLALAFTLSALTAQTASSADKPEILDRAAWGAKSPILNRMKRQTAREIIIHHTGVRQQPKISLERKLRGLQGYSQNKKAWGDSPYHYYIGVSGRIGAARDVAFAGDTNTKYSVQDRIQVVVEGHFDRDQPTKTQLAALEALVVWLAQEHTIPADAISGHNDHAQTDCPGKRLKPYLTVLRARVAQAQQSTAPSGVPSVAPSGERGPQQHETHQDAN